MTGRRLFVLDDIDALTLSAAVAAYGVLPAWTRAYTMDALLIEGYAVAADQHGPARLTAAGHERAARLAGAHQTVYAAEQDYVLSPAYEGS